MFEREVIIIVSETHNKVYNFDASTNGTHWEDIESPTDMSSAISLMKRLSKSAYLIEDPYATSLEEVIDFYITPTDASINDFKRYNPMMVVISFSFDMFIEKIELDKKPLPKTTEIKQDEALVAPF